MKSLTYTFFALLLSSNVIAVDIPNQFEDGQVTSASQMNENFQALKVEIEALKSQLEESINNNKVTFVGVTEEQFTGISSFLAMGQACNSMEDGSFFCSAKDYRTSIKPANISFDSEAWLSGYHENYPIEVYYYNCSGWTSNGLEDAVTINNLGNVQATTINCATPRPVACCK
jgi:hypothetical protein